MQTQILRRKCDGPRCDTEKDFPIGNLRPEQESELSNWIVLSKEHFLRSGDAPQAMTKLACCGTCAVEIIRGGMLDMRKLPIPEAVAN